MPADPAPDALVPERRAAEIVKVNRRRLRYWDEVGLVRPSISEKVGARYVRMYSLNELLQLSVAAWLREKVSLQQIRKIVDRLREAYTSPLTELRFAIYRGQVYFQHPSGEWEGRRPQGQTIIVETIPLETFRRRIRGDLRRSARLRGRVERRRGAVQSRPVFAGTRIPVESVQEYLRRGHSIEEILSEYPDLHRADVEAARLKAAG